MPADVLFLPMALAKPERAYRYALIATVASVLGGIAGWVHRLLRLRDHRQAGPGILRQARRLRADASLQSTTRRILLLLVTSGLAHLPPIKVVTILSGVVHINLGLFVVSAIIARGARFFFLAWLLRRYGEPIRHFIEKRLGQIAGGRRRRADRCSIVAYHFLAH